MKAVQHIQRHAAEQPGTPLFLYLALQNVHNPLESPDEYVSRPACADIPNQFRKVFCGMAASADDVVANVTTAFDQAMPGQDVIFVLSGDQRPRFRG